MWLVRMPMYENQDTGHIGLLQLAKRVYADGQVPGRPVLGSASSIGIIETSVQYWDLSEFGAAHKSGWHSKWRYTDLPDESAHGVANPNAKYTFVVFFAFLGGGVGLSKGHVFTLNRDSDFSKVRIGEVRVSS